MLPSGMDTSFRLTLWLLLLNLLNYSVGQEQAPTEFAGSPTSCGSVQIVSENYVFTISDEDEYPKSGGERVLQRYKRYRRSELPQDPDDEARGELALSTSGEVDPYARSRIYERPRGSRGGSKRMSSAGRPLPSRTAFDHSSTRSRSSSYDDSKPHSLPFPYSARRVFPHRMNRPSSKTRRPIPKSFENHMREQFGERSEDDRQRFSGMSQVLPDLQTFNPDENQPERPSHKQDIVRSLDPDDSPRMEVPESQPENPDIPPHVHSISSSQDGRKLPIFIEHLIDRARKADPGFKPTKDNQPAPILGDSREVQKEKMSPRDILDSLGPDKLEQLRKLLQSRSAFPGSPEPSFANGEDRGSSNPGRGFRAKRDVDPDLDTEADLDSYFASEHQSEPEQEPNLPGVPTPAATPTGSKADVQQPPTQDTAERCTWIFQKGENCQKLVVKMHYIIDEARDCTKEYLQIQGQNGTETFCERNTTDLEPISSDDKITIEHFSKSGVTGTTHGKTKFRGVVLCE